MARTNLGSPNASLPGCAAWGARHGFALLALALASVAVMGEKDAAACTRPAPLEFSIDPLAGLDHEPPSAPFGVTAVASRFSGLFCSKDGLCSWNSCGSNGTLQLEFEPALDNRSQPRELGYRLRFVSGSVPPELEAPLSRVSVGTSPLHFDLPFDAVVALDATFELVALDRAGNESDASELFRVAFDGCTHATNIDGCVEDSGRRVTCTEEMCAEAAADAEAAEGCALAPGGASNDAAAAGWRRLGLAISGIALLLRRGQFARRRPTR